MSLMMKRTSVREYTKEPVQESDIKIMLEAAMQAPSANNQQPWEFIVVDDPDTLIRLSAASFLLRLTNHPYGITLMT